MALLAIDTIPLRLARFGCAVICVASGMAIAAELGSGLLDVAAAPKPSEPVATERLQRAGMPAPAPADDAFAQAIEEHPLFTPGRRPPAPSRASAEAVATAAAPNWNWRLSGTIVSGDQRAALFSRDSEKVVAAEGEVVDGWMVSAVEPDAVTIEAGAYGRQVLSPAPGQAKSMPPRNPLLALAAKRGRMTTPATPQYINAARAAFAANLRSMAANPGGPPLKPREK